MKKLLKIQGPKTRQSIFIPSAFITAIIAILSLFTKLAEIKSDVAKNISVPDIVYNTMYIGCMHDI